jgi:hypothetical protein
MNNMTKKLLSAIFAVILLLGILPVTTLAAEDVLFELSEPRNMSITVAYENDPPDISFIAPTGEIYDSAAIAAGKMELYDSGSVLYFRIPNAYVGQWKIVYDKKNNSTIEVNCAPYVDAMSIDYFSYTKTDNDARLETKFKVSHGDNSNTYSYYTYTIWAVVMENDFVSGKVALRTSSARIGEECTQTVSLDVLNSYSDYKLMLEVYMDSYGVEVFDTCIADNSFSYTNPNTPEPIQDFKVEVGVTDQYIRLDWSDYDVYCDAYIVVIRAEGADEPVYAAELGSNETATEVLVDLSVPSVTCEIAYKNHNGVVSQYASKTIDLSHANLLTFECDEVTSAVEGKVAYDFTAFSGPITATICVNDSTEEARPEGKGSFSINLDEYENNIKITWFETDLLSYVVSKQVYSDRKAPILKLYEMTDTHITQDKTFILTGSTEPGCTVSVGQNSVQPDENGLFTITLDLVDGLNEFTVTSTSKVGNSSKQVISIEKAATAVTGTQSNGSPILKFLPLIISFLFAGAICIFAFINSKYYGKKKESTDRSRAITGLIRNISIFLAVISALCSGFFAYQTIHTSKVLNSTEFIHTAYDSVTDAYELIQKNGTWKLCLMIALICLGVFVVIAVLCGIFGSEKYTQKTKQAKEARQTKKAAAKQAAAEKAAAKQAAAERAAAEKAAAERAAAERAAAERAAAERAAAERAAAERAAAEKAAAEQAAAEQPTSEANATAAPKFCPQCGEKLNGPVKFCGKCGYRFP